MKVHLARLVDLELVVAHRGDNGAHLYELAWDREGVDGARFVIGLTNPDTLTKRADRSGAGRRVVGGWSGPGRTEVDGSLAQQDDEFAVSLFDQPEDHSSGEVLARGVIHAAAGGGGC